MTDPRDEFLPYWLRTAAPSGANGELLDSLTRPADEPWNDPRPATFAPTQWGSMTPPNLFGLSPTFPPSPPPSSWDPSSPAFLWHPPFGANAGFPAPPVQPVVEPWNDPRSAIFAQTPWVSMTVPPAFPLAAPPEHLDAGKYWPAVPTSSGANGQPPARGFHSSPLLAPSWDAVPTPPIATNTAQMYSQPSPTSSVPTAPSLEHLDSARYWGTASGPSGESEHPPAPGFYLSPVPRAADSKSASSRATSSGPQIFPDPPPYWGASAPPTSDSGYSPAEERTLADDARRDGWERVRRGVFRKPPPSDRLDVLAPSWDQVVPTATPWSVWPKLPSPTSWGETIAGMECYTSGGNLHCIAPGGRQFTVPAGGLRDGLRFAPGEPDYHYYSTPDGPTRVDPSVLTQGVIDNPTVGPREFVSPATPQGTLNEATPPVLYYGFMDQPDMPPGRPLNQVKSYLTTDQTGTPIVVNVTQRGHGLSPGIVVRYVTTSPSGATIQNEGTGLGLPQAPGSPFAGPISKVWEGHSSEIMKRRQR